VTEAETFADINVVRKQHILRDITWPVTAQLRSAVITTRREIVSSSQIQVSPDWITPIEKCHYR
jgi:hypothetical protein